MAPPGRRRASFFVSILFTILLLTQYALAQQAVVGLDIGTEYIKAALVKPGVPIDIVLAKDSKRKLPAVVSLKPLKQGQTPNPQDGVYPERSYGSAAQALAPRYPGDTYPNLKQLLGLPADTSSVVQDYSKKYPALQITKADSIRGTVAFQSPSFSKTDRSFAIEELLAMQLKDTIENAQIMAGKAHKVKSAVLTIPPFYTIEEKAALELAADLAGIKVLGVVTDGLAVGINYATSRTFEDINAGAKPEMHMVYDVGAGYTSATVLKFQGRSVKDVGKFNKTIQEVIVLGTGWDRTLGGDALNYLIMEDMASKFVESPAGSKLGKTAQDILANGRASARMWKDAEKVRQVLSANQAGSASFEELYGDVDFKYKLTRAAFEKMSESTAERLDAPFANALKMANITAAELDSVILHGGAIRTPFINKRLEKLAGAAKLRSNVNSDEAAVFGAAFKAARLTPSFRVKEIRDLDAAVYPTWMNYRKEEKSKVTQQKIFTANSFVGSTKVFTIPRLDEFDIQLFQNRPTDSGSPFEGGKTGTSGSKYQSINVTGSVDKLVELGCKKEDIKTTVTVKLSPVWGLPEVSSGSVSCEHEAIEPKGVMDGVKDFLGFGKKEEDGQKVLKDEKIASTSSQTSSTSRSSSGSVTSSETAKASKEPVKPKIKTETIKFLFDVTHEETTTVPYPEQKFISERIRLFDQSDKNIRMREEDYNNLESFIYRIRDLVSDTSFTTFAPKPLIKELEKLAQSTSSWLSDDGANAKSEYLKEKLKALTDIVDPIKKRREESNKRPELTTFLKDALAQAKGMVEIIQDTVEKAKESAKSASEAASSSLASLAESSTSTESPAASGTVDPLADLEEADEPSSSTTSEETKPTEEAFVSPYSEDDLKEILTAYESVSGWLEKKISEQDKLKEWEEPVLKTGELQKKAKELNDVLMNILQKKMKRPETKSKSKSKSKTRSPKAKATKKVSENKAEEPKKKEEDKKEEVKGKKDEKKAKIKDEL